MDPDKEFYDFLMKTKQNLTRLNKICTEPVVSSPAPEENDANESVNELENFLAKVKISHHSPLQKDTKLIIPSPTLEENDADESVDELENFLAKVKVGYHTSLQKEKKFEATLSEKDQSSLKVKAPLSVVNKGFSAPAKPAAVSKSSFNLRDAEVEAECNFMEKRKTCARQLYEFFNETVFNNRLPRDMPLEWNGYLQSTAGKTSCRRKANEYSCHIQLSTEVLTSFGRLRDTLLHEMCHAACWLVNHSMDSHGPLWRTWASRCSLILPEITVPTRCHVYELEYTYILKCVSCDWVRKRFKMCPKLKRATCPKCRNATVLKTS